MNKEYLTPAMNGGFGRQLRTVAAISLLVLLSLGVVMIMSVSFADGSQGPSDGQLFEHAVSLRDAAITVLEEKIETCEAASRGAQISADDLPALALTPDEWKTALLHLSREALYHCEGRDNWGAALLTQNRVIFMARKLGIDAPIRPGTEIETLCCGSWRSELRVSLDYMDIDPKARRALESTEALRRPFKPIDLIESMGL